MPVPQTESSDKICCWIREARSGDEESLSALLEHYRPYLELRARGELGDKYRRRADPQDLVQTTLLKATEQFPQFGGQSEPEFSAWIGMILSHSTVDETRRQTAQSRDIDRETTQPMLSARSAMVSWVQTSTNQQTPSVLAMHGEAALILARALNRLPEDHRDVIVRRFLDGQKLVEIANELERTPDAIAGLIRRGLKQLRVELRETLGE